LTTMFKHPCVACVVCRFTLCLMSAQSQLQRGVVFHASETRGQLLEVLVRAVFAKESEATIDEILECHRKGGARDNMESRAQDHLYTNKDTSDAVDVLGTMDFESAQAFPELSRAQTHRRKSAQADTVHTESHEAAEVVAAAEVVETTKPKLEAEEDEEMMEDFWAGMIEEQQYSPESPATGEAALPEPEAAVGEAEEGLEGLFAEDVRAGPRSANLFSSPEVLKELCPGKNALPGVSLTQDFRENRFKARYEAGGSEELPAPCNQKDFSRAYRSNRSPREALDLVVDWLWNKHALLTGDTRPDVVTVDHLVAQFGEEQMAEILNPAIGQIVR
jgi:hypothetical protein